MIPNQLDDFFYINPIINDLYRVLEELLDFGFYRRCVFSTEASGGKRR